MNEGPKDYRYQVDDTADGHEHDNPHHESYHAWEIEQAEADQQVSDYEDGIDYNEQP